MAVAAGLQGQQAELLLSPRTEMTALPSSFLTCGTLWRVEYHGHNHPIVFDIGVLKGQSGHPLSSEAMFLELVHQAGLTLSTEPQRIAYAKAFLMLADHGYTFLLESVRDVPFTVPRTVEEIRLEPEAEELRPLFAEDVQVRRAVEDRFGPKLAPLRFAGDAPWRGMIHAIKRPASLVKIELVLDSDGWVDARETVEVERVPVTQFSP